MLGKKTEKKPAFEHQPLPPDTFEKVTEWSTPDGKAPVEQKCRVTNCRNTTTRIPPVCDDDFYGILGNVRNALIREKAQENGSNGRH